MWFLEKSGNTYVVLLAPAGRYGQVTGVQFQIATVNNAEGTRITQEFFKHLEVPPGAKWQRHYPYVGGVLEEMAASYDREAGSEDSTTKATKRLRYY